jgi:hypothetical protein
MGRRVSGLMTVAAMVAATVVLVTAPPAIAGDTVVATTGRATPIDAFAGHLVWSYWDPQANAYRLVELAGGAAQPLPIAPRSMPFDVDLGPDRRGRTIAVYSRCTKEPIIYWELDGRRGCDLYEFSFTTNRERKLRPAGSKTDEYFPTVWRNRIAFTRTYRAPARVQPRRLIYWRSLSGGQAHRVRTGRHAAYIAPHDLDLRGNRVAVIWQSDYGAAEIRVDAIGGRSRLISTVPGSPTAAIEYTAFGTSLSGSYVYWMIDQSKETPYLSELRRHAIGIAIDERAQTALDESIDAFTQDGDVSYYALPSSGVPCNRIPCLDQHDIHRLDGLTFERAGELPLR